jgi:hypothetical protein
MKVSLSKLSPVRLSSPWGRQGGVIPFGEGLGERLLLPPSEGLGEAL